jgi:hypothetical protein
LYVTLQSADKTSSPSCNIFVFMWTKDSVGLSLWWLTPLSTIFQLCRGGVSVYKKGIIKYHAVGTVPKSNRIIIEKYPYTQIHDRSTAWLGTGT